ncbi:MAG: hypothetical protein PHC62_10840 [Candidatus Izemoplasmatales bacterium]|nr:hypothetical protein [Candidatus Izemoplasmatales bacterium]
MTNIISIIGLLICILAITSLLKSTHAMTYLKIAALFLLVFKTIEFTLVNVKGEFSYPIEISTITYFMFSITLLFNVKKYLHVATFFAIISGIGFFLFYSLFGSVSLLHYDIEKHIISVICHGILLVGGVFLLMQNEFNKSKKFDIYVVMLAILGHASIFYIDSIKNTTFIYYLIKPEFLQVFSSPWQNYLVQVLYYLILMFVFNQLIAIFYKINRNSSYLTAVLSQDEKMGNFVKSNPRQKNQNMRRNF